MCACLCACVCLNKNKNVNNNNLVEAILCVCAVRVAVQRGRKEHGESGGDVPVGGRHRVPSAGARRPTAGTGVLEAGSEVGDTNSYTVIPPITR